MMSKIARATIRQFEQGDEAAFRRLNEEWISYYFEVEGMDEEILANPRAIILDPGGAIFLAIENGEAVGCCGLMPAGPGEYEVVKMAVTPRARGGGIGRELLRSVIQHAREIGARRLFLETNARLKAAIHLYESFGFQHLPPERITPSPYVRADVYMELLLEGQAEAKSAGGSL